MKTKRILTVLAGFALAGAMTIPAVAQDHDRDDHGRWQQEHHDKNWKKNQERRDNNRDRDHDRDRYRNNGYYNNGRYYPNGTYSNRGYYPNGNYYPNSGYYPNRGYYPNGTYYPNGSYGTYGNYGGAFQSGYQTGLQYGQHDRMVGKAFRPTDAQVYSDARGMGGVNKQQFRQGYQQGYQRGYYGR
jgi:Ni/Co efflux regulator RcnB